MGKRGIAGKLSLWLFGTLNVLMLAGPAILPAYRSFVKIQFPRSWRNRGMTRRSRENIQINITQREFDQYREGDDEIWLGNKLYDIESLNKDSAGVHLKLDYDQEETRQLALFSDAAQKHAAGKNVQDSSARWLHWLSELVNYRNSIAIPALRLPSLVLFYRRFSSAIRHRYDPVGFQPPDVQLIS